MAKAIVISGDEISILRLLTKGLKFVAEMRVGLVSDDNALFEFWYRNATSLGYAPSDFRFMLNILRTAQEAWAHHVYYAEINGLPVLDEFEYIRYFILNHCPKGTLVAEIIS